MKDARKARCFDKDWRYVPANATDISKTFARVRRQMKEAEAEKQSVSLIKGAKTTKSAKGEVLAVLGGK